MSGGEHWIWGYVASLGLAVITLVTRAFFMVPERELPMPEWLKRGLRYARWRRWPRWWRRRS
jgi:branched-subunit amino acid transport protein